MKTRLGINKVDMLDKGDYYFTGDDNTDRAISDIITTLNKTIESQGKIIDYLNSKL